MPACASAFTSAAPSTPKTVRTMASAVSLRTFRSSPYRLIATSPRTPSQQVVMRIWIGCEKA